MSNPMHDLHALGLNPFAVTLLAESMLKSAYVTHCGTKPLTFEFPVRRGDCEGWAGVRITIEAVPAPAGVTACGCEQCGGTRGGTPGNENIVDGRKLCDCCHADLMRTPGVPTSDQRQRFDEWFRKEMSLPPETDTASIDAAWLPYRAWKAALASGVGGPDGGQR